MEKKYNFAGWATKNDLQCSDGRIIRKDAFAHCDGKTVPLIWNHDHKDPYCVIGHAELENRDEGVYAYGYFNDSNLGKTAKMYVEHGDINQLSIYANQLKQQGPNVIHGMIRELSLVMAGANPGACIESVMMHGEESEEEAIIFTGEDICMVHMDSDIEHAEAEDSQKDDKKEEDSKEEPKEKTIDEVYEAMTEDQKTVVHVMVSKALENGSVDDDTETAENTDDEDGNVEHSDLEGGNDEMKTNVFDQNNVTENTQTTISHADQADILKLAKSTGVGSFRDAFNIFMEENAEIKHAFNAEDTEALFPDHKDVKPGAPELLTRDVTWIDSVIAKTHKSPVSRIRTRQADARGIDITAFGYKKGEEKKFIGNAKLMGRTTDPQTVYVRDSLHRDDIIDITDFDIVAYLHNIMKMALNEKLALSVLIGDGLEDGDVDKISEEHIRSIWNDDELYTIHADVDIAGAKAELQGTNTAANFGDNYVYAEAIISAALYSREKYKGSGSLEFYCTPHLLNVMLLARDLNGRRIYDSKADLAAALNVTAIHTVEQFEGKTRKTKDGDTKKLLGLFVNLSDYQIGSTKGGELSKFSQFDIDFNKEKYLIETRLSGALTRPFSAIALEEPVDGAAG